MKNQKGLGLIGALLIIGALVLTAGGVVVWERRASPTSGPVLTPATLITPTTKISPPLTQIQPFGSLDKKIQLSLGQTVFIKNTNLSLTLSNISIPSPNQPACCPDVRFDCPIFSHECPVVIEIGVRNGIKKEVITFQLPGFGTQESREVPWRNKEIFGFRIRIEEESPELVILTVKKL